MDYEYHHMHWLEEMRDIRKVDIPGRTEREERTWEGSLW